MLFAKELKNWLAEAGIDPDFKVTHTKDSFAINGILNGMNPFMLAHCIHTRNIRSMEVIYNHAMDTDAEKKYNVKITSK